MKQRRRFLRAGVAAAVCAAAVAAVFFLRLAAQARELRGLKGSNVLLVTLDTTRADRLGCYGYERAETPVLDAIAREGVLFERCITPTAFTLPSHSSIMTGKYPASHGVRINGDLALSDAQTTLAERFAERGYRTGGFIGAFVLDGRWGLKQGFERYDDNFDLKPGEQLDLAAVQRPANQVVDAALAWLKGKDARPFFAWVHLYDPHTPYEPPEPWRSRLNDSLGHLYDGEIAFADAQLGRLLDWLAVEGLDSSTIVVVVGDHGEGLGDHKEAEHGYFVYDYAVHVPFLVRLPVRGFRGTRVPAQVRTIDIAPTILDLVGFAPGTGLDGQALTPLLAHPRREGPVYAYSESMSPPLQYGWSALYSVRTAEYKYIEAPKPELYDLRADPDETDNRIARLPAVAGELRDALHRIQKGLSGSAADAQEANIDEETMRRLASLGYIGGTMTVKKSESKLLADPKDMLHLYNAVGAAVGLITDKDYKGATGRLEEVLKEDPGNPQARFLLALCYEKTERNAEAKGILDGVLKDEPENLRGLIAMAGILAKEGNTAEMIAICKRAIAKDSRNAQAYALIAGAYIGAQDHAAALPYLKKAVEIQPKLTRNRNNLAACLIGMRRFDEAEAELKGIIAEHPKFPLAHFNLGLLYEEQGRRDDARGAYTTEVELHPNIVAARFNLSNLMLRSGEVVAAEEQLRQLVSANADEPLANLFLARALLTRSADPAEALPFAQKGLDKATTPEIKALGWFLLADIYSRQGRRADVDGALRNAQVYKARAATTRTSPPAR